MVVRARRKQHHDVGVIPERPAERAMWLVMRAARRVLVRAAVARPDARARPVRRCRPSRATRPPTRGPLARRRSRRACCLVLTIQCWRRMGRDWRMDISDRNTSLITDGLFAEIRHPIYAFSIATDDRTAIVLPTPPMLVVAAGARRADERQGAQRGGSSRADARRRLSRVTSQRTGRFLPRPSGTQFLIDATA